MGLKFSIEIKLVEVRTAVREKGEIEHQDVSKFTFSLGLLNFSDFDAGIKTFGSREPSDFFGLIVLIGTLMKSNKPVVTEKHVNKRNQSKFVITFAILD